MPEIDERDLNEMLKGVPQGERAAALAVSLMTEGKGIEAAYFLIAFARLIGKQYPVEKRLQIASMMVDEARALFLGSLQ